MIGRIAVTGGCGGIGRALVAALDEAGATAVVVDRAEALAAHPPPPGAVAVAADLTDPDSAEAAFADLGALDGLVHLCGFPGEKAALADTDPAAWASVLDGNLTSAFLAARAAAPRLGRGSAVVLVSSGLAAHPRPGYGAYAVAKGGIVTLTRLLAAEMAPAVRVNAVAPGAVDTAFLDGGTARPPLAGGRLLDRERYLATVPLGRLAEPDDVVDPILFFLGPGSRYVTGQTLHVNGGAYMG